jgi:hypothetical protein
MFKSRGSLPAILGLKKSNVPAPTNLLRRHSDSPRVSPDPMISMSRAIAGDELDQLLVRPFNAPYYETQVPASHWVALMEKGNLGRGQFDVLMATRRYALQDSSVSNGFPSTGNWRVNVRSALSGQQDRMQFDSQLSGLYDPSVEEVFENAHRAVRNHERSPVFPAPLDIALLRGAL